MIMDIARLGMILGAVAIVASFIIGMCLVAEYGPDDDGRWISKRKTLVGSLLALPLVLFIFFIISLIGGVFNMP